MRICITLILSVLFLFLGIQAVAVDAQSSIPHPTRVVMPLSEQSSPDSHQLADTRHPHATQAVEFADAHTLAYRLSLSAQRMNRFSSLEFFSLIRQQLRKLAL